MDNLNKDIEMYKNILLDTKVSATYQFLIKYLMSVKSAFDSKYSNKYKSGYVAPGYMDFSYFSFSDTYLRDKKLRFGIVLNHKDMQFELWLMGQNKKIQAKYWELLKDSKWNEDIVSMPIYSVLELSLVSSPNFNNLDVLTEEIIRSANNHANIIIEHIKSL